MSDDIERLVRAAQSGDSGAFDTLVRQYRRLVQAVAMARLQDPEAAADACQEAFLTAYRRLPQLREPARFEAWLCRIAANWAQQLLRRRRREVVALQGWSADGAQPAARPVTALPAPVVAALHQLTPAERETLCLRYGAGLAHRRIAALLGISEAASRARLRRALQAARCNLAPAVDAALGDGDQIVERVMDEVYRIRKSAQAEAVLSGRIHRELLGLLAEGPQTPTEIAAKLGLDVRRARQQAQELVRLGLAQEAAPSRGRRGAAYQAVAKLFQVEQLLDDTEYLPQILLGGVQHVVAAAAEAYQAEGVDAVGIGRTVVLTCRCTPDSANLAAERLLEVAGEVVAEFGNESDGREVAVMVAVLPQPAGSDQAIPALEQAPAD